MPFLTRWFSKKNDASPAVPPTPPQTAPATTATPPLEAASPVTAFDLARLLAWDFRSPNEQWFVDTCLRMDINMANARFAWEAVGPAFKNGNESFARGALFMTLLAGASPSTRAKLAQMMSGK